MTWEVDFEHTSRLPRSIVDTDAAFQQFDEGMNDIQSQARSLLASGQFASPAEKHAEDSLAKFVRDAQSIIDDSHHNATSLAVADLNFNPRRITGVFNGVIEQVAEDRFQDQSACEYHHWFKIVVDCFCFVPFMMCAGGRTAFSEQLFQ